MTKLHKEGTITKNGSQGYIARIKNPKNNKYISKRAKTKIEALQPKNILILEIMSRK